MSGFDYEVDDTLAAGPTLGLLVLSVDETIEADMRRLLPTRNLQIHVSRLPSGDDLTTASIHAMETELPRAARLLPARPHYDAIGYACTSGATLIGRERVAALVRAERDVDVVTDPLGAVLADCGALGITRLAMISPYTPDIGAPVAGALADGGVEVVASLHLHEAVEANVARITPDSLARAARDVAGQSELDGIFLSCTNLRALDLVGPLEDELGLPVLTSNLCLARALARAAGTDVVMPGREQKRFTAARGWT